MAPLQLKRFKVGSKMAVAASAPVLPNQKKTMLQNRPIHWRTLYNLKKQKKHASLFLTNTKHFLKYKTYYMIEGFIPLTL